MQSLSKLLRRRPFGVRALAVAAESSLIGVESPYLKYGSLIPVATDYKPLLSSTPETKVRQEGELEGWGFLTGDDVAERTEGGNGDASVCQNGNGGCVDRCWIKV